jgi:anti-sigma regulatory factor (Ser/Thr protein kinase)
MTNPPQPWFNRFELACEPAAVRWARMHARSILKQWDVPESVIDDAELVVSELTTNAVRHSGSADMPPPWVVDGRVRRFVLTLWRYPDHMHIYVYDQDRTPPVLRPSSLDDNGGRGLHLVEQLASKWGYTYPTPHPDSGKAVWAQLDFPGNPAPTDVPEAAQAVAIPRQSGVPSWRNDPATMNEVVTRLRDGVTPHGYAHT